MRRLVCVLGIALAASLLAACQSGTTGSRTTPTPKVSATPLTGATNVPTSVPNQPAVRGDVTLTTCEEAPGGWKAGGKVTNRLGHDATYDITVFFTTTHATVVGFSSTSVSVKAGGSADWQTEAKFGSVGTALCVLRGVSAT